MTRIVPIALLLALLLPARAAAGRGLLVGVDDDSLEWTAHAAPVLAADRDLGLGAIRITLDWQPGQWRPTREQRSELGRVTPAARLYRIVLAVTGPASAPPLDDAARDAYCGFVSNVLARAPWIRDVVVWTEPNSARFWVRPSAAAYEALLARCWDVLHALHPGVNVIAASAPHHDPGGWYRRLAAALKGSARGGRIFDTVGHNAYPETSAEAPSKKHAHSTSIDEGDYDRLVSLLRSAFAGTGQPPPGRGGVTIWYMEDGFQTTPSRRFLYSGAETDRRPVGEETQAGQLAAAVRLAYCQPFVGAFFNFELVDERDLGGWQSGVLRADFTRKPAFDAFRSVIAQIRSGTVRC